MSDREKDRERHEREVELASWGFDLHEGGDRWLESLREADLPTSLGDIGSFELLEEIDRGGQGVVFKARQKGTKRIIAIKRLIAGSLASSAMRKRFEREVELASSLKHPGIVTVYGVENVDGVPILAMEWVDGDSVVAWSRGRSLHEVLELFTRIADAVAHAHSRGVLHRDLKPSNILVDAQGQPRVLDFGLSKRLDPDQAEGLGSLTASSELLGTPAYMSPEQVRHARDKDAAWPDHRTDVYSLGVMLYEMITGYLPYDDSPHTVLDAIVTKEPVAPSRRDSRVGRSLETVLLHALEKDPDHRYASIEEFGSDIRRYLSGTPIHAAPPSLWTSLGKLASRHRRAFSIGVTFAALLMIFAGVVSVQALRLRDERDRARLAQEREAQARSLAENERRKAEVEKETKGAVLDFLLRDMLAAASPVDGRHDLTIFEAANHAKESLASRFEGRPEIEAAIRRALGELFQGTGHYDEAEAMYRSALQEAGLEPLERTRLKALLGFTLTQRHQPDTAERILSEALVELRSWHSVPHPDVAQTLTDLALAQQANGNLEGARAHYHESLEMQNALDGKGREVLIRTRAQLASLEALDGRWEEAERHARVALDTCAQSLGTKSALYASCAHQLAVILSTRGELQEARDLLEVVLQRREAMGGHDHPSLPPSLVQLANLEMQQGAFDRAAPLLERALAILEHSPTGGDTTEIFALHSLASLKIRKGRMDESLELAMRAQECAEILGQELEIATTMGLVGEILFRQGHLDEAVIRLDESLDILRDEDIHSAETFVRLASVLSACQLSRQDVDAAKRIAEEAYDVAVSDSEELDRPGIKEALARQLDEIAVRLQMRGESQEAELTRRRARSLR